MTSSAKVCGNFIIWFLMVIGLCFFMASLATSYWRGDDSYHEGIFFQCYTQKFHAKKICELRIFFHMETLEFESSRLLMLGSAALLSMSFLLNVVSPCAKKNLEFAISVLNAIGFLCMTTALSLYTFNYHNSSSTYHWQWSYYISWLGCFFYLLAYVVMLLFRCIESNNQKDGHYETAV